MVYLPVSDAHIRIAIITNGKIETDINGVTLETVQDLHAALLEAASMLMDFCYNHL